MAAFEAFTLSERGPCTPSPVDPRYGQGRFGRLAEPLALADAVTLIKGHLGLAQVRVSPAPAHGQQTATIRRVAVCAGAGGSVFEKLSGFDRLSHRRDASPRCAGSRAQTGTSVVLCDHTNTERGYLRILAARLAPLKPTTRPPSTSPNATAIPCHRLIRLALAALSLELGALALTHCAPTALPPPPHPDPYRPPPPPARAPVSADAPAPPRSSLQRRLTLPR